MNFMQSIHHSLTSANHLVHSSSLSLSFLTLLQESCQSFGLLCEFRQHPHHSSFSVCWPFVRDDSSPDHFLSSPPPACRHFAARFLILCHNFSFPIPCIQTIMTMRERLRHLCFQNTSYCMLAEEEPHSRKRGDERDKEMDPGDNTVRSALRANLTHSVIRISSGVVFHKLARGPEKLGSDHTRDAVTGGDDDEAHIR